MYIRLPDAAREALSKFAAAEWRDPRDQAALMIVADLRKRGLLARTVDATALSDDAVPE